MDSLKLQLLVRRSIEADDAGSDDRVPRSVAEHILWPARRQIHEGIGVKEPFTLLLATLQVRANSRGVRVAVSPSVLDDSAAAQRGDRKTILQRQDTSHLPASQNGIGNATRIHESLAFAEWQFVEPGSGEALAEVECGESPLQPKIVVVRRRQAVTVRRPNATSVIDRLAVRVGTKQRKSVGEALLQANLQGVIAGMAGGVHVLHAAKLREWTGQVRCWN